MKLNKNAKKYVLPFHLHGGVEIALTLPVCISHIEQWRRDGHQA